MKNIAKILFLTSLIATSLVSSQEQAVIKDETPLVQKDTHHSFSNKIDHIKDLVAHARIELHANKNSRPTTQYSVQDIAFTLLPKWLYPQSMWKQDLVTRRRQIAKVVRSSPLIARPRSIVIRDKVANWTRESSNQITREYISQTTKDLESLLESASDFISAATDVEMMDPLFLSAGYLALDNAINDYLNTNKHNFDQIVHNVNHEFNHIVTLAGDLRVPLESLRDDVIHQTKFIRTEMFQGIEHRLRHFGYQIRHELSNLLIEVKEVEQEHHVEASKALRKHTADGLRAEIQSMNDIKVTLRKSQHILSRLWENATDELVQSPAKVDYWLDVAAEVKEAVMELGRLIVNKKKEYSKGNKSHHHHCACGWSN